ncbi:VOC family protein [Pseudoxanthomonas winnipegensis]|uniref:Catechol 2,3-dioxygenase-like lactoylglutathione lyase family enzyme n=2 Tax=Pseudoxanthomonas TaxID=83618 RepID=A0AAW8G6P4_9GAMM|nr:catechol 2,3-dioxygenase-like lactoylglutathione lyase family enzyme [Pseudoxanthomonas winnipegensis]MDR6138753.1 catechol 2,3-dioxygenase-like lactoylglutathione lyase family enzyme [Pseudoxanthomonas sp. SORGH_AS_0997]TBV75849.1 VOC family protein [Pseudoxanthomonas winnipegensis]
MTMLDHIEFPVTDAARSCRFYEAALAPLGFARIIAVEPERTRTGGWRYGLGQGGYPCLWIHDGQAAVAGMHLAFASNSRLAVDAFHKAALAAGGTDNGPPGVRERYHARYYAAYVLDPDGVNVEVVCQR